MIKIIKPKKYIFISFDGAYPQAKTYNRIERHITADVTYTDHDIGRLFGKALRDFVSKKIQSGDKDWTTPEVMFAPQEVAGEADIKIFDFIRKQQQQDNSFSELSHCIYTIDVDLILLSLRSHIKTIDVIYSLRENDKLKPDDINKEQLEVYEISKLREKIAENIKSTDERIYDDIVSLISIILGSDYCRTFYESQFIKLNDIIEHYTDFIVDRKLFIIENDRINFRNLETFMEKLIEKADKKETEGRKHKEGNLRNYRLKIKLVGLKKITI